MHYDKPFCNYHVLIVLCRLNLYEWKLDWLQNLLLIVWSKCCLQVEQKIKKQNVSQTWLINRIWDNSLIKRLIFLISILSFLLFFIVNSVYWVICFHLRPILELIVSLAATFYFLWLGYSNRQLQTLYLNFISVISYYWC